MDPFTAAAAAYAGSKIVEKGFDMFGDKQKADRYREALNKQIEAEESAYKTGKGYYDYLEGQYTPEAESYLSDLAGWRGASSKDPIKMGDFDTGKYDVKSYLDPSMAYQQQQAAQAINQSAAARGGMFAGTGKTAKALQDRATQLAQQDYANAFQRMTSDRGFGYDVFTDKFKADRQTEEDKIARLADMLKQSGAARENLFKAKGGATDLSMAKDRAIGDLRAGKDRTTGDLYGKLWEGAGDMFSTGGKALSSSFKGGK